MRSLLLKWVSSAPTDYNYDYQASFRPEDIANGVLFFVAEEASWVTGQVISIDGGYSIF